MTTGTTMGEIRMLVSNALPGNCARVSPIEASVPSTTASSVDAGEMIRLFFSSSCHVADDRNSWYQRNENPAMGYIRNESALNDSGMITRIGTTRKTRINAHSARSA